MATGGEYLKIAAANIRRAAQAMQEDISNIERNMTEMEKSIRSHVDDMGVHINNNNMRMANPQATDIERADRLRENGRLDGEIANRKHELNEHRERSKQQIASIQREMQGLNSLAADLDRRGSS